MAEHFGPFELLRRIDAGGMGEIFLARRTDAAGDDERLVVKRLLPKLADDPAFVEMFRDEGRLAVHLVHDNICRVLETAQHEGTWFLTMEWIEGVSLRQLLERARTMHEPMPLGIAAHIASRVAAALHYAHTLRDESGELYGVVHRDVSPTNIMLGFDGRVKLLDFGFAKAKTQAHQTLPGMVKGKFRYLAPEQTHAPPVDGRADIFALGLCLFEMLHGMPLFDQERDVDTVLALREHREPPSSCARRPELPSSVDTMMRRALAAEPADRFQTADQMHRALEPLAASSDELSAYIAHYFPPQHGQPATGAQAAPARAPGVAAPPTVGALGLPPALGAEQEPATQGGSPSRRRWRVGLAAAILVAAGAAVAAAAL